MNFKQFVKGPDSQNKEETDEKLSVEQWINELTDGKGLDQDKVYIIVGSFINKLKK